MAACLWTDLQPETFRVRRTSANDSAPAFSIKNAYNVNFKEVVIVTVTKHRKLQTVSPNYLGMLVAQVTCQMKRKFLPPDTFII
jgi:hypothetical protein